MQSLPQRKICEDGAQNMKWCFIKAKEAIKTSPDLSIHFIKFKQFEKTKSEYS